MYDLMTVATQRRSGRARLAAHSSRPDRDIDALLCDLLGLTRAALYVEDWRILTPGEIGALDAQIKRIEQGEPYAYVRGREEFWSFTVNVTPKVLIPRPDTELLVEVALAALSDLPRARVLELGTGSGAVALALATERKFDTIVATDVSGHALDVARANQQQLALFNISFRLSDWYGSIDEAPFDLIVSNPPYIDPDDPDVEPSVRDYEPGMALFAGDHGLEAINAIIAGANSHLKPGGTVLMEHGWKQHAEVGACLHEYGFTHIASHRDLAGHYRVTGGSYQHNATDKDNL